jgi:hypothetical protein
MANLGRSGCRHVLFVPLAALALAAGCARANTRPADEASPPHQLAPRSTSTRVGTPSLTDRAAIEAAYQRFWNVGQRLASSHSESQWRAVLADVATEPLLSGLIDGLHAELAAGSRPYGTVVPHVITVEIDGGRANLLDCQDASRSGDADADTGLPRTVGRARTPVAATLQRGADGRWRVSQARYLDGQC